MDGSLRTLTWEDCTTPESITAANDKAQLYSEFWQLNNDSTLPAREITEPEHHLAWQKAWEHFQTLGLPEPKEHLRPCLRYVRADQIICTFIAHTHGLPTIFVFGPPHNLKTTHQLNAA